MMMVMMNKLLSIGSILFLMFSIVYFGADQYDKHIAVKPIQTTVSTIAPVVQDQTLLAYAQSMNMDVTNITLEFVDTGEDDAQFIFEQTGKVKKYMIHVKPGMDENYTRISLAHEYYHYIWTTVPATRTLTSHLQALYAADGYQQDRMSVYRDRGLSVDSSEFANELWAIYCSETSGPALDDVSETECNKYVGRSMTITDR